MITATLVFDHSGRVTNRPAPIEVRINHKRKSYYISTGIKVVRSNFVGGSIVNQADSDELNRRLQLIYRRIQDEVNRCIVEGTPISTADIRRRVSAFAEDIQPDATPALDWLEEQIPKLGLRHGTLKHYYSLISRLHEWQQLRRWKDINAETILEFDSWLHARPAYISASELAAGKPQPLISNSGVYNYHKCLKALLNRAVLYKKIVVNPYDQLRGQFKRGERETVEYLTEAEMRRFVATTPPRGTAMDVAHDLFIFQMYTGLSYSDAQAFDLSEYREVDGRLIHTGERIKTGVPFVSQLLPPAKKVVDKYNGNVPKMDNADYNRCLKALGMVAGIEKPLHSHMARHTFATFALRKGVKIENLSRMLGHTNITQTQRYAKVMAQSVHDDYDLLSDQI